MAWARDIALDDANLKLTIGHEPSVFACFEWKRTIAARVPTGCETEAEAEQRGGEGSAEKFWN